MTIGTSIQAKTGWERQRKRENKNYRSISSHPTRNRKFQKNSKKLENTFRASLKAKTGWERQRKRENKNYRSDQFLLDPE